MKHEKQKNKNKKWKYILGCLGIVSGLLNMENPTIVMAANAAQNMAVFDGVTLSPDGTAWTTDYMDKTNEHLPEGYTIYTGVTSGLRALQTGEHYYNTAVEGDVPVSKWVVVWSNAQCIHNFEAQNYKGFQTNGGICEKYYNNGWQAYCADCGDAVAQMLIYGKSETVGGITGMAAHSSYVYLCPHCYGLEQGVEYQHICKDISYNYYKISYEKNAPFDAAVQGYMAVTRHMYNNAAVYEGKSATEKGYTDTKLRKNSYTCEGYVFCGWNTQADGSGQAFSDAQSVINLSSIEGDTVTLYAQWERAEGTLVVDANGGTYNGENKYYVMQKSQTTYKVEEELLEPAPGFKVEFEENGGSQAEDIYTRKCFVYWKTTEALKGTFQDNLYTFPKEANSVDVIQAQYSDEPFTLPYSKKENESLVGWYLDEACSDEAFAGKPGDEVYVSEDTVLYAKWAVLLLWAEEDYTVHEGVGAVDLTWEQKDGQSKFYKLYQSLNQEEWKFIYESEAAQEEYTVQEYYDTEKQGEQYVVPHTGYYKLSADGAKGGDFDETYTGGNGGSVSAEFWLKKGDVLTFFAGESGTGVNGGSNGNGADGGEAATEFGRGGGAATEIYLTRNGVTEPLLIAGGGSGAGMDTSGKAGGSNLTETGNKSGESAEYGGGGGGAMGGQGGTAFYQTTLENPDIEDIALKSEWTQVFPKDTQVYSVWKRPQNYSEYPELSVGAAMKSTYFENPLISVGNLAREVQVSKDAVTSEEYHYGSQIVSMPGENTPLSYKVYQSRGGFVRKYVAAYPTNGNTNVVVSGLLNSWGNNAISGYIRFRILDADTEEVLYDETLVDGVSLVSKSDYTASWCIGAWSDFNVEGADNIQVEVWIYGEAIQAHFNTQVLDTFFYGKKIGTGAGAEGGSSYINPSFGCKNPIYEAGTNAGDGFCRMESEDIGYFEVNNLEDVPAPDRAAPGKVSDYEISEIGDNWVKVIWTEPTDYGTTYYHKAESYKEALNWPEYVATSNITANTLVSGVKGYFYYVDTNPQGMVTKEHEKSSLPEIEVLLTDEKLYLHIAAADVAGNLGETCDIELKAVEKEAEEVPENPRIFTRQLRVKESDFVYAVNEKLYYVKADGKTEHTLLAEAGIEGAAMNNFQVDSVQLCLSRGKGQEWLRTTIPHTDISYGEETFANDMLQMNMSERCLTFLHPEIAVVVRKNHGAELALEQNFTVNMETSAFEVYPQVLAEWKEDVFVSETEKDMANGLTIIPDGAAPVIEGLEELQELDVLDMTEETKVFELTAWDELSGLAEFTVYISNRDNYMSGEFTCDSEGRILLEIDKENALFIGDIGISAIALDRVGNAGVIGEDGLTFTLDTKLYRERNPEQSVFKTGDGAVLEIRTSGYVDRVEVIFPDEMLAVNPELNKEYVYEYPYLRKTETLQFNVPLGIAEQEYEIIVNAYKNGEMLSSKPTMAVVEGNVLDELRTRIRNNG